MEDNPVGSMMNGITVIMNLYRLGGAEPTQYPAHERPASHLG